MKTSIIILAQHESLFKQCLASIELYTSTPYELIVVNDGNHLEINRWLEINKTVKKVTTTEPVGVAAGYNLGAKRSSGDLLIFIRDHMIVSEHWLVKLTDCLERNSDAAMVGPLSNEVSGVQLLPVPCDNMQQLDKLAAAFVVTKAGRSKKVTRLLSHLLAVSKSHFNNLGGFDERFGMETFEDDDLCYRALQAGYGLYIAQDCFVRYIQPPSLFPGDPKWYSRIMNINREKAREKWGFDLTETLQGWIYKTSVSLCMIVKNEEETLERCLSSISQFVDEIIIVDTGSEDKTKEIARQYTDKIHDFQWVNDFAKARNYAFSLASKDYILWLDADDVVLPEDADKFQMLLSRLAWNTDAVSMNYNLAFDDNGNVVTSLRRNRLVKRENNFQWIGVVHEYLEVYGNIQYADICITHDRKHTNSSRNLHIYENRLASGEMFSPRDLYYYSNELADHKEWHRAIQNYEMFLMNPEGWIEDKINACGRASDCFRELGVISEAKSLVLRSFVYTAPRAEGCCRLGYLHMMEEDYQGAVYWYKMASELLKPSQHGALLQHAAWTWLPHLQLCVCYDRLGQLDLAHFHNERAADYIPNDSKVQANRTYFQNLYIPAK
ncbi:glycosyltransferase [Paenibacillus eucommiae]|uniref:Glycosyltransferase involved in cell wall biosynthesis n=1 Tax=Paenibacillus eucommiae TaxID=1355755 RepID=A0ABS4J158_9BACL|nr:glycosyltransferase [Paenibacillus eucommiae]MBP1993564.1 glycosyltransferase involved in cell wall biosynthesis [Paenibacillus eucommiae]